MEYTKEELEKKFNSVPENIQGLILDENFGPAITLLCKELGVDAVKALDVEDETLHVLIGISDPKDFIHNIQTKIGVDEEKARAIAEKVNDEIFQLVKESLKVVHNITETASEASVSSAPLDALRSTPNVPRPPAPPQASLASQASVALMPKIPEAPRSSQNIFEQKLQGVFKMPKEETLVPPRPTNNLQPTTDNQRGGGVDPYREAAQ